MWRPPAVMFRNGPRLALIACVMTRTVAKVTKKAPVENSWRSLRRSLKCFSYSARRSRSAHDQQNDPRRPLGDGGWPAVAIPDSLAATAVASERSGLLGLPRPGLCNPALALDQSAVRLKICAVVIGNPAV